MDFFVFASYVLRSFLGMELTVAPAFGIFQKDMSIYIVVLEDFHHYWKVLIQDTQFEDDLNKPHNKSTHNKSVVEILFLFHLRPRLFKQE